MRVLQDFIDQMTGVDSLDDLRGIFKHTLEGAGFRYFTYHIVKVAGIGSHLPYFVTTYPDDWVRHYIDRDYVHIDPLIEEGPQHQLPFQWEQVLAPGAMTDTQKSLFVEARDVGIESGMTIPIHGRNGEYASMTLVPDGTAREQRETLEHQQHMAHLLSLYYHNHAGSYLLEKHLKQERRLLTPREREILTWVARGKSTWEISQILNVAERTVLYHIENAKTKLDVTSRTQLVVKAIMQNLIEP